MQLVRIGSLMMWNIKSSQDYGCMGLVISLWDSYNGLCFNIKWTDNSFTEYNITDIDDNNIKVVNF